MAAEPGLPRQRTEAEQPQQAPQPAGLWGTCRRLVLNQWVAIVLGVSVFVHAGAFGYYHFARAPAPATVYEIPLGAFRFAGGAPQEDAGPGRIAAAEFSLYVTLLDQVDRAARDLLAARRFRVQQAIEQLLRQAHSGDFEDPSLRELKRHLREQINESLGVRAIGDVIVTDLKLSYGAPAAGQATGTRFESTGASR